ncbi:MAG: hypothetical protein ABIN48_12390 [Ginsengibacter sp.]
MYSIVSQSIGYLATLFLGISLMTKNSLRFRWINASGCLSFVVYGIMIGEIPIIISNFLLLVINIYFLIKLYRTKDDFDLIEFKGNEKLIGKFLDFYSEDIQNYFPKYYISDKENSIRFVIMRDMAIANIFVAEVDEHGLAEVILNFTIPQYRDYQVGRYLLNSKKEFLQEKGVTKLHYNKVNHKGHAKFLKVIGFSNKGGRYFKDLATV